MKKINESNINKLRYLSISDSYLFVCLDGSQYIGQIQHIDFIKKILIINDFSLGNKLICLDYVSEYKNYLGE